MQIANYTSDAELSRVEKDEVSEPDALHPPMDEGMQANNDGRHRLLAENFVERCGDDLVWDVVAEHGLADAFE